MSTWRIAKAIPVLESQVNAAYPNRPKGADGTIGDTAHQQRQSDHNPTAPHAGVVTAWDITTDTFSNELADELRAMGAAGDGRVKYVIFNHRFTSDKHGWQWVDYDGPNGVNPGGDPHTNHIHLSVGLNDDEHQYDRTDPWPVLGQHQQQKGEEDMTPQEHTLLVEIRKIVAVTDDRVNKLTQEFEAYKAAQQPKQ